MPQSVRKSNVKRHARLPQPLGPIAIGLAILIGCAGGTGDGVAVDPAARAHERTTVVPQYVGLASDDAIHEYLRVTVVELEELRDRSYRRCHAFLFGDRADAAAAVRLEATLSTATREAGARAAALLVDSAAGTPVVVDEAGVHETLDRMVLPRMPARYRERVVRLHDSDLRMLDTTTACDVAIDLYRVAVDLPLPEGPQVRRHLLARLTTAPAEGYDVH